MASDEQSDDSHSDPMNDTTRSSASENGISRALYEFSEVFASVPTDEARFLSFLSRDAQMPVFVPYPIYRGARIQDDNVIDQALLAFPPPEDLSHHFSDADLGREIEQKFLSFVANACNDRSNSRRLSRKAKLDQASVWSLNQQYGDHIHEYIYRILLVWKRRHPEAKVRDLVNLLSESLMTESVVTLKKYLNSIDWRD